MKKRFFILLLSIIFGIQSAVACCAGEPHTFTELLLHDTRRREVFLCKVLASHFRFDGAIFSDVEVIDVYKGQIEQKRLQVFTGLENSSIGGSLWSVGQTMFVCSDVVAGQCSAGTCDAFSRPAGVDNTQDHWAIAIDFYEKTMKRYTGRVQWKNGAGVILASGRFVKGKPHGAWIHNDHNGKIVTTCTYKKGLLHGVMTNRNYAGKTDTMIYKYGQMVNHTIQSNFSYRTEDTTVDLSQWGALILNKTYHKSGHLVRVQSQWNFPSWISRSGLDGPYLLADTFGQVSMKGTYFRGAKVGEWLEWDKKKSALVTKTYDFPTIPPADFYFFHENGQVSVMGKVTNLLPDSIWNYYNDQGQLISQCRYVAGVKQGDEVEYYADKDKYYLKASKTYVNGLLEGSSVEYSTAGVILQKIAYQNGQMNGHIVLNNYDGKPRLIGILENGVIQGTVKEYINQEHLRQRFPRAKFWVGEYKNGVRIGEWTAYDDKDQKISVCHMNPAHRQTFQSSMYGYDCRID
jgi:antitoxin component YwqK of YwqJK toxin-antitoxin module